MTETSKTLTFVALAGAAVGLAFFGLPRAPKVQTETIVGEILNPVEDPLSATRLEIVKFNESNSTLSEFEVAQINNRWVIPSHQNYPADAEHQMSEAATCVMNLKILGVETTHAGDHEIFGVIDPQADKLSGGAVGVGTRVTMRDKKDDTLVNMVIGKKVKDQEGQRYVREVGKDPVYIVSLDASKLSTKFSDWIEKDLLQLNPLDVVGVNMNDYSFVVEPGPRFMMDPRSEIDVRYDEKITPNHWQVVDLKEFDHSANEFRSVAIPEDEELNQAKLDDLRNALGDLKIVDVETKPKGLSEDLKAEAEFAKDAEAINDLVERGFYPMPKTKTSLELFSSEGEVISQTKEGVEYVLRFGRRVLGSKQDEGDSEEEQGPGDDTAINRYLLVTARFNEDLIPKPEALGAGTPAVEQPLEQSAAPSQTEPSTETDPVAPGSGDQPAAAADDAVPTAPPTETPDAAEESTESSKPEDEETPAPTDSAEESQTPSDEESEAEESPAQEEPAVDEAGSEEKAADANQEEVTEEKAQEPNGAEPPAEDQPATAEDANAAKEPADPSVDAKQPEAGKKPAQDAEKPKLTPQQQRQIDDYNARVAKGKQRVKDLNERFGDWYYVISEDVYKKIHLSRKDIFQPAKRGPDDLEKLKQLDDSGLPALPGLP